MNKSNGFGLIGIIISTVAGVIRVGPGGEREPLIGHLPLTDQMTLTARSLIPGKNYPNKKTLLKNAERQQSKGPRRFIG